MIFHYAVTAALAALRVGGVTNASFQAAAHLYVGLLLGLAVGRKSWSYIWLLLFLTAVETVCFLAGKLG